MILFTSYILLISLFIYLVYKLFFYDRYVFITTAYETSANKSLIYFDKHLNKIVTKQIEATYLSKEAGNIIVNSMNKCARTDFLKPKASQHE